jgi:hypothetical protein
LIPIYLRGPSTVNPGEKREKERKREREKEKKREREKERKREKQKMARFACSSLVYLFLQHATAHFLLQYPPTIGFDDSREATPPCGSFTVDFSQDNVTDFYVDGSAIAVTSIHPEATWLFRATLDLNATTGNWSGLLPTVQQTGLGNYCEPSLSAPSSSWAGRKGVIGVVQDAPDGILYQVGKHIYPFFFFFFFSSFSFFSSHRRVTHTVRGRQFRGGQSDPVAERMQQCDRIDGHIYAGQCPILSAGHVNSDRFFFFFFFFFRPLCFVIVVVVVVTHRGRRFDPVLVAGISSVCLRCACPPRCSGMGDVSRKKVD